LTCNKAFAQQGDNDDQQKILYRKPCPRRQCHAGTGPPRLALDRDGNFELTGIIKSARLGMPHGVLEVDADGEIWTVEAGQPWRHERAGLDEALLVEGTEITVSGGRSADAEEKRVKAERITIAGKLYNLYPDRS
jgi:hypothetical protein